MTTVGLPDTSTYTTIDLVSCLVAGSARAYGSEGWGFESLRRASVMSRDIVNRCRVIGIQVPGPWAEVFCWLRQYLRSRSMWWLAITRCSGRPIDPAFTDPIGRPTAVPIPDR
jgi:hypothetical protein